MSFGDWGDWKTWVLPGGPIVGGVKSLSKAMQGPDPASKARPYLDEAQRRYEPYAQQGQDAYNQLNPAYNQMINDPGAYLANLSKGYEQSPGYDFRMDEMLKAAGGAAAAGGMRGNLGDIQTQGRLAEMLAGDDFQQWLQNVMGVNKQGLEGQQHFYDTGYDATNNIANVLNSKGGLAYQSQANKNKSLSDLVSGLLTAAGTVGGAAVGGPAGAAGGGALAQMLSKMFSGDNGYSGDMSMFGSSPAGGTPSYGNFF